MPKYQTLVLEEEEYNRVRECVEMVQVLTSLDSDALRNLVSSATEYPAYTIPFETLIEDPPTYHDELQDILMKHFDDELDEEDQS